MRIISQDGAIDIPYEQCVIQRFREKIYFLNKNLTGVEKLVSDMILATYSSEEKAEKAMEMLHITYKGNKVEEVYQEGTNYYHPTFQFPADEDVKV